MTSYIEIFKEIVDIVHHDYAGYEEKRDWDNPDHYLEEINRLNTDKKITQKIFVELVTEYLMAFQDQHMYFRQRTLGDVKTSTRGFYTRRYEDALYVVKTYEESRFPVGTKIISIDHQKIGEIIASKQNSLRESSAEREDWSHLLNKSSMIEIEDKNGKRLTIELNDYEPSTQDFSPSMKKYDEKTILITLPNFLNVDENLDFVSKNENNLRTCINLIIDVRNNHGGNGKSFSNLLPYIFPPNEHPSTKGELKEFNYTKRNSDLFIELLQWLREDITDEETLKSFDSIEEDCEKYRGQGFVKEDFSD